MIDWTILTRKYKQREAAQKFEELALMYVRDVYSCYEWIPTKGSRDGNKDAHLGKGAEFDAWEEAKFKGEKSKVNKKEQIKHLEKNDIDKKELYKIRRQDLDTTILSGILQGNVRLIIFVSNSDLPKHLFTRAILSAKIRNIEVSFVLNKQLEDWLYKNQAYYEEIFEEKLPRLDPECCIIEIVDIALFDLYSHDFTCFENRKEFLVEEEYILTITIDTSHEAQVFLSNKEDLPFEFINHKNCDNIDNLKIISGLNNFTFLIRPRREFYGAINIVLKINNQLYNHLTNEVVFQNQPENKLAYAKQLEIINAIKSIIGEQSFDSTKYIITIFAESGMGKSYVLKSIYMDYILIRDMTIVNFEPSIQNDINNILLCKVILFLNYGNIFLMNKIETKKQIQNFKNSTLMRNNGIYFNNDILSELIDGCFNGQQAAVLINKLLTEAKRNKIKIVKMSKSKINKILLLDDVQYLTQQQSEILRILCNQLSGNSNTIIVLSATIGKFRDKITERIFSDLTPNYFKLEGLNKKDKEITLRKYFGLSEMPLKSIAENLLSASPLLTCEILRSLKTRVSASSEIMNIITAYNQQAQSTLLLQDRFMNFKKQYYLLDIIYRFKRGINKLFILDCPLFTQNKNLLSDIKILIDSHIITKNEQILFPYHDYYVQSYMQLRKNKFYNINVGQFLTYLLQHKYSHRFFDENQLLSQAIRCENKIFKAFKDKIQQRIQQYIYSTNFGMALYYCEYYYEEITKKKSTYTNDELHYIYLYADCLVHSSKTGKAEEILEQVYNLAPSDSLEHIESGASLLNQYFWRMNLNKIIADSYLLQYKIEQKLKTHLSKDNYIRMKKAQETCYNRRMVTQLILDSYADAYGTYNKYLLLVSKEMKGDDFRSATATIIMDYARGISYLKPQQALHLMKIALLFFKKDEKNHFRRIILCEIDLLVLRAIVDDEFKSDSFLSLMEKLYEENFYSEYFKALLKYYTCKIIVESKYLAQEGVKSEDTNNSTLNEALDQIYKYLMDIGFIPKNREKFLLNSLFAYIYARNKNIQKALNYLDDSDDFVLHAGNSYHKIIKHNKDNITNIKKIMWCTCDTKFESDIYFMDCRFW